MPSGIDIDTPLPGRAAMGMNSSTSSARQSTMSNNPPSQVSPHSSAPLSDPNESTQGESVEVVLNAEGNTKVINDGSIPDQNVFRYPQSVRPRGVPPQMRVAPRGGPPVHHRNYAAGVHPMYYGSGSWGYGPYRHGPPPPAGPHPHLHHAPYPVPHYPNSSGSFDEQSGGYHHPHQTQPHHFSPHVHYPGPRFPSASEEVNVISPNHKTDPHQSQQPPPPHHGGASPARPRPPYYYPPASPVSRPDQVPPRLRSYAMRRSERSYHRRPEYDWSQQYGAPPGTPSKDQQGAVHPPLVADSFDSGNNSSSQQLPQQQTMQIDTPKGGGAVTSPKPVSNLHLTPTADPHVQFYGGGGSWESFDSAVQHIDDRQNGNMFPPDSPYSPYTPFSPLYAADSFPSPYHQGGYGPPPPVFSYSHDESNIHEERMLRDYHPDHDKYSTQHSSNAVTGQRHRKSSVSGAGANANAMLLPKAAQEVDFDVVDPPLEPTMPESDTPICEGMGDVNGYDVLCGRGGGTNSQIGNRRFRQLVQEFQPIYLVAKRKEKPLLARSIVLIIRKRGGRFLKKNDDTGELFEVGDTKAEAKTSQALREGLDVRATRSAVSKKKKKGTLKPENSPVTSTTKSSLSSSEPTTPQQAMSSPVYSHPMNTSSGHAHRAESPPRLPKLQGDSSETPKVGFVHPHSPDHTEIRKRRRVRATERFVGDFLPPRADITRPDDDDDDGVVEDGNLTPIRRNNSTRDDSSENMDCSSAVGCAGIALDLVTGAAAGSFCLGPKGWRR